MQDAPLTSLARRLNLAPRAVARLRSLTSSERAALLEALPVVVLVRLALWFLTMNRVHQLLDRRAPGEGDGSRTEIDRTSLAVARAARLVPAASCLTQALSLQYLLRKRGVPSRVEIGFLRSEGAEVKGHAWLVCDERVVIGGRGAAGFTRTLTLES